MTAPLIDPAAKISPRRDSSTEDTRAWFLQDSPQMETIRAVIESIAGTDTPALLRGEPGVGKDVVARAIHAASSRRNGPFVKVNCAVIPPALLESELFGQEKDAFPGAHRRKPGQFEYAHGGTIFLDEIAAFPLALQVKLLDVLQGAQFCRLGSRRMIAGDSRVIAATKRNLEQAVATGTFRDDLYRRLSVGAIRIPPLREQAAVIPVLASRFLARFNAQYGRTKQLAAATLARLTDHSWPGNVRELENVMRRIVLLADENEAFRTD